MKLLKISLTALALTLSLTWAGAQNGVASNIPSVDMSGNKAPRTMGISADNITWQRDVYRMLDLKVEQNAPLYFPPQPDGQRKNLFSLLFDHVANGDITVYDYLDGKEIFTEEYQVKFEELLNRFWIPYETAPNPADKLKTVYKVETADIPSNEVTLYYVKEVYYLDQTTSSVRTKVIAFCPVLVREDETGEVRKYPLFWVPMESVSTLLSQHTVSTSSFNAASRSTIYDYLVSRRYKGDIYKVYNLQNQNIMDYCKTPEEIAAEQVRLEKELKDMTQSLWLETQSEAMEREQAAQGENPGKKGKKAKKK